MMSLLRQLIGLDYADSEPLPAERRQHLRDTYANGVFSQVADGATANYHTLFLLALHASDAQIGLLATLSQVLTALAPLPGAWLAERIRDYRRAVLGEAVLARLAFLALIPLPLLFRDQPSIAVGIAIAVFSIRAFLFSASGAPWTALMGQLIPAHVRAAFFSARNFAGGLAVILGTFAMGQIITALGFPAGYMAMFALAVGLGLVASYYFARVPASAYANASRPDVRDAPDAPDAAASKAKPAGSTIRDVLRHGQFVRYTLCACVLNFAVMLSGPYIQLFQVRVLGFSASTIGAMVSFELVTNIAMQRVYGSVFIRRFGDFRVMRVLRLATALVPVAWAFVVDPLTGLLASASAGIVWSGHELANFNGLLAVTPETNRANYIAVNTVAVALFGALGPAVGAALVGVIGYQNLFLLSAGLRFLAGVLFIVLVREWARKV